MKNLRKKNGFNRLGDAALLVKAELVLQNMRNNPSFPSPSPTYQQFIGSVAAFSAAVQRAQNRGQLQIAEKNSLRAQLIESLHQLCNYVLLCAAGNVVIAKRSGFEFSGPRKARPPLKTPEGLVLSNGVNRGELWLKLKRVADVQSYRYEITEFPATEASKWNDCYSTVSKHHFTGLTSGKEYCCRVAAIGIKEQEVYSDVVSRIAL